MRKFHLTAAILGLSFLLAAPGFAAEEETDPDRIVNTEMKRSHDKLKRGAINIGTFPLEIVKQTRTTIDEGGNNIPKRVFLIVPGIIKGLGYSVVRLASGVWDVATFNNLFYEENEPILKPDYVWDEEQGK